MFEKFLLLTLQVLEDAAFWMVFSFAVGGLIHEFVPREVFQKHLGGTNFKALSLAVFMGMLLPMCSCGVIPLGLSFYWSGASLAATLAFMAATPIINPAAALLAIAMFGPQLAAIYIVSGYYIPMLLGWLALRFGGKQYVAGFEPKASAQSSSRSDASGAQNKGQAGASAGPKILKPLQPLRPLHPLQAHTPSQTHVPQQRHTKVGAADAPPRWPDLGRRILHGLRWGFFEMGAPASKYIIFGALLAGGLLTVTPQQWIQHALGNPGVLTISATVLLGTVMYVCSVGHIPFVAALLATGASPGVAMTFLISGVATNAPELVSIHRLISPRAAVIYAAGLIAASVAVGLLTDRLLLPDYTPVFSYSAESGLLTAAKGLNFMAPPDLARLCVMVVVTLGLWKLAQPLRVRLAARRHAKKPA